MPRTRHTLSSPLAPPRRRRPARRLDPFGVLPTDRRAAAMDALAEAQELFDDLVALLDAGLVEAVVDGETVRYAPTIDSIKNGLPNEPVTQRARP